MFDSFPMKTKVGDDSIFGDSQSGSVDNSGTSFPRIQKCCVPNCEDISSPLHRFPANPCRSLLWINKINSKLLNNNNFNKILQSCFVCHAHFRPEFKVGRKNLTLNAVPTLNLPVESKISTEDLHTPASDTEFQIKCENIFEAVDCESTNVSLDDTEMEYIVITEMDHQTTGTSKELDINVEIMTSIVTAAKVLRPLNISEGNVESNFNTQIKKEELPATSKNGNEDYQISNASKYLKYLRPYECKICGFQTLQNRHLTQHLKIHKNNKFKVSVSANFDRNLKSVTNKVEYACQTCSKKFFDINKLLQHFRIHKKKKLLACELCDYKTTLRKVLKEHLKIHTKENSLMCEFCDYTTKKQRNFKNHLKTHMGLKPHMCEVCGKTFTAKFSLQEHLRIHTGDKPYLCQYCDYRTTHRIVLKRHLRTHTGEKPHVCHVCGYRASRSIELQNHMKRHTGEKPYMCDVCGYRSSRKDLLTVHFRIHSGEKNFACNLCDYKCRTTNRLKEHTRTHTGEKPFSCTICDFSSAIKANLQNHMSMHTKTMLQCQMCDYNTPYKGFYRNHLKKHQI